MTRIDICETTIISMKRQSFHFGALPQTNTDKMQLCRLTYMPYVAIMKTENRLLYPATGAGVGCDAQSATTYRKARKDM